MNVFEAGTRKVIPAVLIYAKSTDGRVLMVHRGGRSADYHEGKWNGLGGKLEADESPLEASCREFFEESGIQLELSEFKPLGTLQFPNFKAHKSEDWLVFVMIARLKKASSEYALAKCPEGELHWIPAEDLTTLNLWQGDRYFISQVIEEKPFVGTIWYQGQDVVRHWIAGLS